MAPLLNPYRNLSILASCCQVTMMTAGSSQESEQSPKELGLNLSRILARDGATPRVSGIFYKVVVQSVLLFGWNMGVI
jgi:hypothetical protein